MALASPSVATDFARLLEGEDERVELARAALTIARVEYPELRDAPYLAELETLAARTRKLLGRASEPQTIISALNRVLFDDFGLRGNRADYYDPRNSFLNDVLDRRLGIPITLSLVYMEVARRLGFPLFGVGLPGHFLLKYDDEEFGRLLIDPFNRGQVVTAHDCQQRLDEVYSGEMRLKPEFLAAVTRRQILTRMLNNLKSVYLAQRNFRKALPVVDLVLTLYPRSPEDVRQRALMRYSLGQMTGALADLDDYGKMSPDASDADEIREMALSIRRMLARMN